jgi:two-component system chemotaxis sensor kinase CheA
MLPISVSFSRFPRLVRDLSAKMGKKVNLTFSGEATELDKNVLEKISDPLVHLVRNSLDHGIESPAERLKSGKPETGKLELSASHENGNVVIRVEDDGAGLNREKILATARKRGLIGDDEELSNEQIDQMIFRAGFSTATEVSDVSGRGVGMDVVRNNIKELSGRLEVQSEPGRGSVFSIRLPLTLAILDGQLARVANDAYVFPLQSIVETVQISDSEVNSIFDAGQIYRNRDQYIPIVRLRDAFGLQPTDGEQEGELLVIVESEGSTVGLLVDELLEQQQVVIKSLEENYRKVDGLAGATILGDGQISLIIDVPGLIQSLFQSGANVLPGGSVAA